MREPDICVRLLGPVSIVGPAGRRPVSGRPADLLALLASDPGRRWSRDQLLADLWSDAPTASAPTALRVCLTQLRRAIEQVGRVPAIEHDASGWRLTIASEQVDAGALDQRIRHQGGRAANDPWTVAAELPLLAALAEGPPLGGCNPIAALDPLRRRLDALVERVDDHAVDMLTRTGLAAALEPTLRARCEAEPDNEQATTWLARCLYHRGRHEEAATVVATTLAALALRGLLPSAAIRSVEFGVLNHNPGALGLAAAPQGAPRGVLPSAPAALVGRACELAALDAAERAAAAGPRAAVVVIEGQAGIGKSALVGSWASAAATRTQVLHGCCVPDSPPFVAILQAIPGLAERFEKDELADLDRTRLLIAAATAVASSNKPVAIIIDDAHWVDAGTAAVLQHLLAVAQAPLLLVLATRPERGDVLDRLLARTHRDGCSTHLPIGPLDDGDVRNLAQRFLGGPDGPDAVDSVVLRARGHPLFAVELAAGHLNGAAAGLPPSAGTIMGERRRQLDEEASDVVDLVAVLGGSAYLHEVVGITGRSTLACAAAVARGAASGLLVDGAPIRFSHPLYAEAAVAALGASRRSALHATVAAVLQVVEPLRTLRAARHALRAGESHPDRGSLVAQSARAAALALAFEDALDVLDELDRSAPELYDDVRSMAELVRALAAGGLGRPAAAAAHLDTALALARRASDPGAIALVVQAHQLFGTVPSSVALVPLLTDEVLPGLAASNNDLLLLDAIWAAGLVFIADPAVTAGLADEAEAVATRVGTDRAKAIAGYVRCYAAFAAGDPVAEVEAHVEIGLRAARRARDPFLENNFLALAQRVALQQGDLQAAWRMSDEQLAIGPVPQQARRDARVQARRAGILLCRDELDEASALMADAFAAGRAAGSDDAMPTFAAQTYLLRLAQGRLHELGGHQSIESDVRATRVGAVLALAAAGRAEAAAAAADAVGDPTQFDGLNALVESVLWVDACRATGRPIDRRTAAHVASRVHEHAIVGLSAFASFGPVRRAHALVLAADGRQDLAIVQLRQTIMECDLHGNALWSRLALDDLRSIDGSR